MRCQEKEIEKAFWENGLKQWILAILAASPFQLARLWFRFLLIKQWPWCETALRITRAKSMHLFVIFQLNLSVEWKIEEKDFFFFLIDICFGNWAMGWSLLECLGRCSSTWTECSRKLGQALSVKHHPAFQLSHLSNFLMLNTFSDKIYRGLKVLSKIRLEKGLMALPFWYRRELTD